MIRTILPFIITLPPIIYSLIVLWSGWSWFGRRRKTVDFAPAVTILKPVKGVDADSLANFASFCCQEYRAPWQLIFACASQADPVIPVIRELQALYPGNDIDIVVDERIYGPNYKVCNLLNAFPKAKHEIIIVCDSDIRVGPDYLREVCAPFADPQVGLVTSLYRSSSFTGFACAIEAMGFTTEMVPNVIVAQRLEGLSFALGASMAVRRQALADIGGFAALVDYLADDYQLGNKVHLAGWRILLSDEFVESVMHRENLATVLSRQLRWARTMRVSRPGGYFASGITQAFPFALLALLVSGFSEAGMVAAANLYLVRCSVALVYSRTFLKDEVFPRCFPLLPLRDFFAFATWGLAFLGSRVSWRGHRYRLLPGGKMEEIPPRN